MKYIEIQTRVYNAFQFIVYNITIIRLVNESIIYSYLLVICCSLLPVTVAIILVDSGIGWDEELVSRNSADLDLNQFD